jgi:hypothetical protein
LLRQNHVLGRHGSFCTLEAVARVIEFGCGKLLRIRLFGLCNGLACRG